MVKRTLESSGLKIIAHDTPITDGCSKYRPDFLIEADGGLIIVEVDEYQHRRKTYPCECEISRMKQIYHDLGIEHCKLLFIRYNPDKYQPSYGTEFTPQQRLDYLIKYIRDYDFKEPGIQVVYLFYDF